MRASLGALMENAEMLYASLHNSVSGLEKGVSSSRPTSQSALSRQPASQDIGSFLFFYFCFRLCFCLCLRTVFAAPDWRWFSWTCVDLKMQWSVELDSHVDCWQLSTTNYQQHGTWNHNPTRRTLWLLPKSDPQLAAGKRCFAIGKYFGTLYVGLLSCD